jgi:hypothetical protein
MYRSRGERDDRAATYDDDAAVPDAIDDADRAPPPRRRAPRARPRSDLPPLAPRARAEPKPLGPPRTLLSVPPPPAGNSLSPIYPTPKFSTRAEPAEKFGAPIKGADGNQSGSAPRAQD